ncbi:D-tyrosyl-tRNA(Tyr) deacylase, partial [Bacteroides ovatus]
MTIEERLNEIVEKGQGDAIIPFLQGLTQEERKTLVPCLNKLEEHYNKFVQLNENTYGTRGTPEQHRIINLTALVIYSLKEFRKHEWGIYTEQLNELIPWYIPSWIDSFFKEGESKEFGGFYGMNYETLMDWIEQGVLTLTPSPQTIAGYLVNYMNNTDFLQKRAITLKEHIWYLFQYDCGQNWTDNRTSGQPYFSFRYFVEHGQLDRMRVLKESLLAVNRNLNKNLSSWFAGMFTALNPSTEEQLTLQPEIFAVLSAPHSRPVNIILGLLKNLCTHPQFQVEEFLSQTSVLFASDVKAIHQNTLAILHKLAKERKEHRDTICCAAAQGLMSREESTQSKIVKLIQTYGETASTTLKEVLSIYTETMLANTKKELKAYLENNEPEDSASFTYEPILPIIREDNRIQEITSTEDLIFLASQVLDVNEIYHFDLLLGALVKWDRQQEAKQISQWTPILQRAYKLLMSGGSSRNGILD